MNIDEVMEFAPYIQIMLDRYAENNPVAAQCLAVSAELASGVEMLIKKRLPRFRANSLTLEIGNLLVDGVLQFDEGVARRHAQDLPPPALTPEHVEAYHAWLQFDRAIIDLTIIYTAFAAKDITHLKPGAVFISSDGVWAPQDYGFQYRSYRSWSLEELRVIGY